MANEHEALKQYATTPRQIEVLDALIEHGSTRKAAAALEVDNSVVDGVVKRVRAHAARKGHAPGHWDDGVAPGYLMGKVTVHRINGEKVQTWERMSPEAATLEAIMDRCEQRLAHFPRFKPVKMPPLATAPLTNFLGLFDLHLGEKISADDPADRWDIDIAKRTVTGCAAMAIQGAPKAKRLVLCFGGDVGHYDGLENVTPRSKHVLKSDGDFDDLVDAVLDTAIPIIDLGLHTHEEVHVIWAEGNHDQASSVWMRKMLARLYAHEPRLSVVQSKAPFYALRFGKVFLAVHHGHGAKMTDYAGIFASLFRKDWGLAEYAYAHRGHEHHYKGDERGGMITIQHPSLAPSDDFARGKGLTSLRGCLMTTYHDEFGDVGRQTYRPEMLN